MSDAQTLLPATATPLAVAMDLVDERLFDLPVDLITRDPWKVSAKLLDHLAWEVSVDAWDAAWPEHIKRSVIAASEEVHRYKGTPFGIKRALLAFGVEVELVEWWQPEGSGVPGTFVVRAYVTDPLDEGVELDVSGPLLDAINASLRGSAPVSRTWALQLGVQSASNLFCGVALQTHLTVIAGTAIDPPPVLTVAASRAVIPQTNITTTVTTS